MQKIIICISLAISLLAGVQISFAQNISNTSISNDICLNLKTNILYFKLNDATTNGEVTNLQEFLVTKRMLSGTPTGFYGKLTVSAVRTYQKSVGISPTGNVGPITRAQIKNESCVSSSNTSTRIIPVSNNPVPCTMEYRLCTDGSVMPRDLDCTWRDNKCSSSVLQKAPQPPVSSSGIPASIQVMNMYNKEMSDNRLFPMFTVSGIDNSSLLSITLKEVIITKGGYVSIQVKNSCNGVVGGVDQILPNYSISGLYTYGGGKTGTFSCPAGIQYFKNGVSPLEKVATIISDSDMLSYSITASDSWGAHADVNGKTAPSGRLSFYGVKEDGTEELIKVVTFRYYVK